jgi:threonine aldolase
LQALKDSAGRLGLRIHMDGARFANAVVSTGAYPKELSWQAGVDVLCLGGSKNGLGVGEMVVFFNKPLAAEFDYRCKQAGQLCSKMRFMAAPWVGLLRDGAWLRNAANANRTAQRLEEKLRDVPGLDIAFPCEANSVFVRMPSGKADAVRARAWRFYETHSIACSRLMCSWDTTDEDVDQLAADIRSVMTGNR